MGTERERIQVRGNLGVMMLTSGIWTFGGSWPGPSGPYTS